MHEWLPSIAAVGIGVPISVHFRLGGFLSAFLFGGLSALFMILGHY